MDLTDLPSDVFLIIVSYLNPQDSVLCRSISRAWHSAFTSSDTSWSLMRWHFSRCREMSNVSQATDPFDWSRIFPKVARRYFHLRSARPRLVEKVDVVQEAKNKGLHRGVEPWNRWLRWNDKTAVFQYRDPTWCFGDGLLIYRENMSSCYVAYDLETRHRFPVPFDGKDKTVRRLRFGYAVLIFEWCERDPYYQLNDREQVHRHFATAFDVRRLPHSSQSSSSAVSSSSSLDDEKDAFASRKVTITFRSEWKIHFLGLPINRFDRFFSAHTATHYALYLWQPNPSPWGEEDPLEQLIIWDITHPSSYRPSLDPTGVNKPELDSSLLSPPSGPLRIKIFSWLDLEFLGLRQRHTPSLREILLDDSNVYIHEEGHRWLVGQHSSLSAPRHHHVRCTAIPFAGVGPRWFDECCADGDVHLSFCPRSGSAARFHEGGSIDLGVVRETSTPGARQSLGPGRDPTWPGWAPCWRHEEFPYLTVSGVVDFRAGVRIVGRQCFMMEALSAFVLPKISFESRERISNEDEKDGDEAAIPEARFADDMWVELMGKGKIVGDERWVVGEDVDGRVTIVRF